MMKNYYSKMYLGWEWTEEIVNEFLNNFEKFNAHEIDVKKQEYVGIYGPTQVGKTTFILSFIGIKKDCIKSLSVALRGKQNYGKSSTVTATLYERIQGDKFVIVHPDQSEAIVENLEELAQHLKNFRYEVTNTEFDLLKEMIIKIPDKYFYSSGNDTRDIIIIDLPGDDSKDSAEAEHVEKILAKYLVLCRTIIIMELGNQLTSLSQLTIDSLKNWRDYPDRFIISFTRGIINQDVKNRIKNNGLSSNQEINEKYRNDLETAFKDTKEINNIITFFELGDSLEELEIMDRELFNQVNKWNEENFEVILEKIKKNDSPEFRIKNLTTIINNIEQMKKIDLDAKSIEKKELENNIIFLEKIIEDIKKLLYLKEKELEEVNNQYEMIKEITNDDFLLDYFEKKIEIWKKAPEKEKFINFQEEVILLIVDIKNILKRINANLKRFSIYIPNVKSKAIFDEINDYLNEYDLTIYKTLFGYSYKSDFLHEIWEMITDVKVNYLKLIKLIEDSQQKDVVYLTMQLRKLKFDLNKYGDKIRQNQINLQKNDLETTNLIEGWAKEASKVKLLNNIIMNVYSKNMKYLKSELTKKIDKDDKLMIFLLMKVVTKQMERVLISEGRRNY